MALELFDVLDECWTRDGLLKVLRVGNGYEWRVFGQHNYEQPLFVGKAGNFFDALRAGEKKLEKDLKQIFWLLNEASMKERREGEPKDAEMIEQAIRMLNAGDKSRAVHFLNAVINQEQREREPEDVKRLTLARDMVVSDDQLGAAKQ